MGLLEKLTNTQVACICELHSVLLDSMGLDPGVSHKNVLSPLQLDKWTLSTCKVKVALVTPAALHLGCL